jgi:CheY-like chemotaxis protein/two-component sensor histidine kinase
MSPMNMNDAIQRVIKQIGPLPDSIALNLDLTPDLMNISGGISQISRALVNVLTNAVDAMSGKGSLSIKTENWYSDGLTGTYRQIPVGEYAKVTICDSGCGIPEKSQLKIFEPFFTTKTADKKRGSGLGLSVVHAVVNDHGGCIDIESALGLGTKVYLYFPITRENVESPATENIAGGSEKILVVDDDQIQREVNQRLLRKLGYDVHVAGSGEQALEFLKNQSADLLILDMIMPGGMDGTQTFVRAREIIPDQKAIIVSGYAEGDRVREARLLGAGAFLKKPITMTTLARVVREEIDRVASPLRDTVRR